MTTQTTTHPLIHELTQAEELCKLCCDHDNCCLTFPDDAVWYGFCRTDTRELAAAACLFQEEEDLFLFCAFTSPSFRRQGLFSSLLDLGCDWLEEHFEKADIEFLVDPNCNAATLAVQSLEATLWYHDFQMSLSLNADSLSFREIPSLTHNCFFCTAKADSSLSPLLHTEWKQTKTFSEFLPSSSIAIALCTKDQPISAAFLTATSKDTVWLHSLETEFSHRNQHFASVLLALAIDRLKKAGFSSLMLHVSSDNLPAFTLYKKTGFQTIKTLSHYLY